MKKAHKIAIGVAFILIGILTVNSILDEEVKKIEEDGISVCSANGGADNSRYPRGFYGRIWFCKDGTIRWKQPPH